MVLQACSAQAATPLAMNPLPRPVATACMIITGILQACSYQLLQACPHAAQQIGTLWQYGCSALHQHSAAHQHFLLLALCSAVDSHSQGLVQQHNTARAATHLSGRPSTTLRTLASISRAASACASESARRHAKSTCKSIYRMCEASMQLAAPDGSVVASPA